ncbi:MAG: putative bifunctional diguanylate cyclase/phosphodiesterase [Sarcina sp.]
MNLEYFNRRFQGIRSQAMKASNKSNINNCDKNSLMNFKFFIILFILAILTDIYKIELIFGISFSLASVFFILILLIIGRKKAIISVFIIGTFSIVFLGGKYIFFIHIAEILAIDVLKKKYENLSVILVAIIFWGLIGIPILGITYLIASNKMFNEYYLFDMIFIVINCLFNVYVAEIIYIYVIKKCILKEKINITFRQVILHIIIATILIPFILNIFTDIFKTNEHILQNVYTSANDTFEHISDELELWDNEEITNLKLSGIIEEFWLEEVVKSYSKNKPFNISILTQSNIKILDVKNHKRSIKNYKEYENIEVYNENLHKLVPRSSSKVIETNWIEGFFVFKEDTEKTKLTVIIEIPISIYKDKILKEYGNQFKFLIFFMIFICCIVVVLNKVIFSNLTKLAINTENYKSFLYKDSKENWPVTDILEIRYLGDNIKKMINELKQNFKEIKSSEERLYELAYYDTLTKLPNRLLFRKQLDESIGKLTKKEKICIVFLDLNRFKVINDSLGHDIGDKLLGEVAARLNELKSENIGIFRLGGDEFVIVAKIKSNTEIEKIGEDILNKFEKNFILNELILNISCSAGASIYPDDSENINTILQYADIAMYKAKEDERGKIQLFDSKLKEVVLEKLVIEKEIFNALEKEEFRLYYQPKYSPYTQEVMSLEALIRWSNKSLGVVSPGKFISIAEESDLIFKIDKWVIKNACNENKKLQDLGYKKVPVAVNISAKYFATEEMEKIVIEALKSSGLEAKYLIIEITEGVFIENFQVVANIIKNLNEIGVAISIDDFGTGYSSFNQLMKLPINEVKIDRAFVMEIDKEERKASIVRSMIELAHRLQLNVVAEGVENEREKECLKELGCDELQGYLFTRPVEIEGLKKILEEGM